MRSRQQPSRPGNTSAPAPSRRFQPLNAAVLVAFHLAALAAPWTTTREGLWSFVVLALSTTLFGGVLGFHRLLSHRSFTTPKPVEYFFALCGALAVQAGPISWVATHRFHHATSDTAEDPHSPRRSFLWSYVGWTCFESPQVENERMAPDLCRQPFYRFLESNRAVVPGASVVVLGGLGWLLGGFEVALSMLVWGFFLRVVYTWHLLFAINAFGHTTGYRSAETPDDSRNLWWLGLLSCGDSFHNNHHAQPACARYGRRWFEPDLAYATIWLMGRIGLATQIQAPRPLSAAPEKPRQEPRSAMPAPGAPRQGTEALRALRAEFETRGWLRKPTGRMVGELLFHLALSLGGVGLLVAGEAVLLRGSGLVLFVMGMIGMQTNSHTALHYAASERRWVNELLAYLGGTLFQGLSSHWWQQKHAVIHHPTPNVHGVDGDIDLMPWFVLNTDEAAGLPRWRRIYHRYQWSIVPFALAFIFLNMQVSSWRFLVEQLSDPRRRRPAHWIDLGMLLLHLGAWWIVPMLFFPPLQVLAVYATLFAAAGFSTFIVAAPAHFPAQAAIIDQGERSGDFVLRQTAATLNFRAGRLGRLLCSGAEFQIEHHLFPDICHVYYPRMSPSVERFCRERGYPYRTLGWGEALYESLSAFRRPRPIVTDLARWRNATP